MPGRAGSRSLRRRRAVASARAPIAVPVLLGAWVVLASRSAATEPLPTGEPAMNMVTENEGAEPPADAAIPTTTDDRAAAPTSAPAPARSSDSLRIAVVDVANPEVTARLVAELRFLGFAPEVVAPPSTTDPEALVALARARGAAAAVAVDVAGGRVQVWIVDRMTGKLVGRQLALAAEPVGDEPREIAVRSVELLRASLLEVEEVPPPPEAEVAVPPAARRTLRSPRPRFGAAAGVAVGGGPGGLPVAAHVRAQFRSTPHPFIGVVLAGTAPLHAVEVSAPEGTARIRTGWLGVGPRVALRRPDATLVPDLAATVGAAFASMDGSGAPGHVGARALVVDAIFEGSAGLEVALSPRIRLRFEAAAATCARTVRVRFSGRPVATWCRPHVLGSLGIGVVGW